jgi:hypothetical protein
MRTPGLAVVPVWDQAEPHEVVDGLLELRGELGKPGIVRQK